METFFLSLKISDQNIGHNDLLMVCVFMRYIHTALISQGHTVLERYTADTVTEYRGQQRGDLFIVCHSLSSLNV